MAREEPLVKQQVFKKNSRNSCFLRNTQNKQQDVSQFEVPGFMGFSLLLNPSTPCLSGQVIRTQMQMSAVSRVGLRAAIGRRDSATKDNDQSAQVS